MKGRWNRIRIENDRNVDDETNKKKQFFDTEGIKGIKTWEIRMRSQRVSEKERVGRERESKTHFFWHA